MPSSTPSILYFTSNTPMKPNNLEGTAKEVNQEDRWSQWSCCRACRSTGFSPSTATADPASPRTRSRRCPSWSWHRPTARSPCRTTLAAAHPRTRADRPPLRRTPPGSQRGTRTRRCRWQCRRACSSSSRTTTSPWRGRCRHRARWRRARAGRRCGFRGGTWGWTCRRLSTACGCTSQRSGHRNCLGVPRQPWRWRWLWGGERGRERNNLGECPSPFTASPDPVPWPTSQILSSFPREHNAHKNY